MSKKTSKFEKTELLYKFFISRVNLKKKIHFPKSRFYDLLQFCSSIVVSVLPFNRGNELKGIKNPNLKKSVGENPSTRSWGRIFKIVFKKLSKFFFLK